MTDLLRIGVDVGGTKVAAGTVTRTGALLDSHVLPTPATAGAEAVLDTIVNAVRALPRHGPVSGVGIGTGGVVDRARGVVLSANELLRNWRGTALRAELEERLRLPVHADNDGNVFALAEQYYGAGRGHRSALHVSVGTGIGGGLVHDGALVRGQHWTAGEFGHIAAPEAGERRCNCGGHGHLEAIASGPSMTALYRETAGDAAVDDLRTVLHRAETGDEYAHHAVRTGAVALGRMLGGLARVIDPDIVVLGGGVAGSGPRYWDPLLAAFHAELPHDSTGLDIAPAELGERAAVVGAAALHLENHRTGSGATNSTPRVPPTTTKDDPVSTAVPEHNAHDSRSKALLQQLRGGLIVSCQAPSSDSLHGPEHMSAMARSVAHSDIVGIRAEGIADVTAIRSAVDLPLIGLWKDGSEGVYITPTPEHVQSVVDTGADIIAVDATERPRPDGSSLAESIALTHRAGRLFMADVSTRAEGLVAAEAGADVVSTTLSGYTPHSPQSSGPDLHLVAELAAHLDVPIVAEGRLHTPEQAKEAIEAGAWAVCVGTAITTPRAIAARFANTLPAGQQ